MGVLLMLMRIGGYFIDFEIKSGSPRVSKGADGANFSPLLTREILPSNGKK